MQSNLISTSENHLIKIQERLEKLLDRLPCMAYRCRIFPDGHYLLEYASQGCSDLLGLSAESLVSARSNIIEQMMHPADQERLQGLMRDSIVAHTPWQTIYRITLANGQSKWLWDQGEAIYDENGEAIFLEGLMMDVSEQKFQEIALQEENRQLKLSMEKVDDFCGIVGGSPAMHKIYTLIMKAAETDANVIIYGETGSGKDMVARAIHNFSGRPGKYVPVNCGAIPENLIESEFFGHMRGAFTGAHTAKEGFIAAAHNGTLFLDEIGELPLNLQVKFLRVLETRHYTPLGSNAEKTSHFRLVAATNRDLATLVKEKKTRADFYYRINVLPIILPPLRERREDIPLLVAAWEKRNGIHLNLQQKTLLAMQHYGWPGNIRELYNFLDRYAAFGPSVAETLDSRETAVPEMTAGQTLEEALANAEREYITRALEKHHWRKTRTAESLGVNLRTLQRRIKALGIAEMP